MKSIIVSFLLACLVGPSVAAAPQPPCWPAQFGGAGSPVTVAWQSINWRCADGKRYGVGWRTEFTPAGRVALTPAGAAALWDANVGTSLDSPLLALEDDQAAGEPYVRPWVVAPLAGSTSRPTSALVGGVLKPTGQRAPVGAPCNCATKLVRGAATWCPAPEALAVCVAGN